MLWCNGRVALALLVAAAGILTAACMAESHGVRIATLAAVARTAIEARPNMAVPDGTYVHATGTPAVTKPSVDPATGIESAAVAMRRTGRIFQWTELRRIIGKGAIRIDHVKQWTSTVEDTTGFSRKGYQNVGRLDLTTDIFRGGVQLAGLTVGEGLLGALDDRWQARPLTRAEFEGVPETVRSGFNLVGGELSRGGEAEIGAARVGNSDYRVDSSPWICVDNPSLFML
jgi:hypothetical protein